MTGIGASAVVCPLGAKAQSPRKPLIGLLYHSNPEPTASLFRAAFGRLGYRAGDTVRIEERVADGSESRLAVMAAELVALKVDVIVAMTTPAVIAAKRATDIIPIIMAPAADPVGMGLVDSLARPGGNITGSSAALPEVTGAMLGLLKEAIPAASRIGLLVNTADPFHRLLVAGVEATNRRVGVDLRVVGVASADKLDAAVDEMAAQRLEAAIIQPTLPRQAAVALSSRRGIPTGSPVAGYAHLGGLMAYHGQAVEVLQVAAAQVDQILKGARPADIPIRQPNQFELVLNLRTAREMGLAISPLLLARADEVIE